MINKELINKNALDTIEKLNQRGFKAYLVGGSVRDLLMGIEPHDFDITTSAKPEEVKDVFAGEDIIETGIKHGTLTLVLNGEPFEITTFRKDVGHSDGRHPDMVEFSTTLEEDLKRRDFTINAIAYNPQVGIVDLFSGTKDIEEGIIRTVGNGKERFAEDGLRILRALRFASRLGFKIEEQTSKDIHDSKDLLNNISAERIAAELNGLLEGEYAFDVIREYVDVLSVFIPELIPMIGFNQHNKHHVYPVFDHCLHAMNSVPREGYLRLSALLHDVGKPSCFFLDEDGVGHFYGHGDKGVEIAGNILNRLKYDNETKGKILTLIEWHDRMIEPTPKAVKRALGKLGDELFFDLIKIKRGDNLAQAPAYHDRQLMLDELERLAGEILEEEQCFSRAGLKIKGSDLMDLGIAQGPEIGRILDLLVEDVIEEKLPNERGSLIDAAKEYAL